MSEMVKDERIKEAVRDAYGGIARRVTGERGSVQPADCCGQAQEAPQRVSCCDPSQEAHEVERAVEQGDERHPSDAFTHASAEVINYGHEEDGSQ